MIRMFRKSSAAPLRFGRFFQICGLLMLFSEIWKQACLTFTVNQGSYDWRYFPFQLCSIPMYILLVLPYIKKSLPRRICLTFLMTFGLLGGIAVFADTSGLHYPLSALTFHSYAWHVLLIVLGILAAVSRFSEGTGIHPECRAEDGHALPNLRDYTGAVLLYLSCCAAAAGINHICGRFGFLNLFYINPAYHMEQIIFYDLVPLLGNLPVIFLYIGMTILGAGLLFLLWRFLLGRKLLPFFDHNPAQHPQTEQVGDRHKGIEQVGQRPDKIQ